MHTQSPPPSALAPVTQYDFLQIPKSDPGWNISARLPRQFASTIVPLLSLRLFTKGYQREDALSVNVCVCACVCVYILNDDFFLKKIIIIILVEEWIQLRTIKWVSNVMIFFL